MAIPKDCPLCGSDVNLQTVVTSHVYGSPSSSHRAFYHCSRCDVRYQHPRLTSDEEMNFYAAEFEGFMASRSGDDGGWLKAESHIAANESTRQRRMKYLTPHLAPGSSLLEVGCSSGFMLHPLIELGFKCQGIEPSGVFSEFLKNRGLTVHQSLDGLFSTQSNKLFDVIMHFFVLEHIVDPVNFLKTQMDLLKPGGKLIFEIPNSADPLYSIYDVPAFERFYWSIAHPWYFSETSTEYLLNQVGSPYEIMREQRYDLSNHMIWARDGRPGGMGRFTKALTEELEEDYKKALIRIGKCDTLVGIIYKK